MLIPIIEQYPSSKPLLEVYRAMEASSSVSFFLDSVKYQFPNQLYSYMGADPFLEVTIEKRELQLRGAVSATYPSSEWVEVLRRLLSEYQSSPVSGVDFFTGGAVGFWGYELVDHFEKIRFRPKQANEYPLLYLGFYKDVVVYDHQKQIYWLVTHQVSNPTGENSLGTESPDESLNRLKYFFESRMPHSSKDTQTGEQDGLHLKNFKPDITKAHFESIVRQAKRYIEAGEIYQANLSQRFSFEFDRDPLELYSRLREINPSPFSSFLRVGDLCVVSCSPERLVRKKGMECETRPIAGTRPRRLADLNDQEIEKELLCNEKEKAEHIMLVDLERNDLGRVCDYRSVKVEDMMTTEKYSHVIHIVSKIVGRLSKGKDAFDLIRALFPGGTITGCPKIRCMEVIDELEPVSRGLYTGSIGYIDFKGDLDLNIVIRTITLNGTRGHFQVGAGIVYDSDPAREYEETLHKGEALVEALVSSCAFAGTSFNQPLPVKA